MQLTYEHHTTCPNCGYTHSEMTFRYDHVEYYKSGKHKGEIKSVEQKSKTLVSGTPFMEFRNSVNATGGNGFDVIKEDGADCRTEILICPGCRILFLSPDSPSPNTPSFREKSRY